ncbi:MAG: glyceraldehyde-3-phosphate dehydrogenase [Anaerolineae bacterium SM23_84]|jgi:glyceraldehyde 3-phosphate dehydrogenase|nr:MAG: glyceraldehyde-3-phosphate dehydrogenase [Anaerolineae bacterium SM23_84]
MAKVAINGLGRIGRATFKTIFDTPELDLVAVNDIAPWDNLVYLLGYDTVYGRWEKNIELDGDTLVVDDTRVKTTQERDPSQLPWGELGVDIVFECTGVFTKQEDMKKHLQAGAKWVILSAPTKSADVPTVVHGVNRSDESIQMISCASCTTNSITPVVEIMERRIGIKKAVMTTIHGYTSTQRLVDLPHKRWRRGRAAAANLVPTTTGAAIATSKALPQFVGKFDGVAVRVPVPVGSLSDITFLTSRPTTVEEVNQIFREEAETERYKGIFGATDDPIVSSDIIKDARASIVDLEMTRVVDGDLVKVMAWYDNEWGYANQMIRHAVSLVTGA